MFRQIINFELIYRLRRPATYIYFFIFLGISFMFVAMPEISYGEAGEKLYHNAPVLITQLMMAIMIFGCIVCAAIMGVPVYRDFEANFHEIMFSLPVKKWEYLWGRFTGSMIITVIIFTGIPLGMILGFAMPWQDKEMIAPFMLSTYLSPFLIFIIPNIFILGVFFFISGSYFRTQAAIYAQGVIFVVVYFAISLLLEDTTQSPLFALLEPFGSEASYQLTKYWTTYEKNNMLVPLVSYTLYNRIIWLGLSCTAGILFTWLFKPAREGKRWSLRRKKALAETQTGIRESENITYMADESLKNRIYQWWYLTVFYFRTIIRSIPFFIMIVCAIGLMAMARFGNTMYGTPSLPITYMLVDHIAGSFMIFLIIIIIVYSGELLWKDISLRFAPIMDASPLSGNQMVFSKFSAMVLAEMILMLVIILTGMTIQVISGFFEFDLMVYIKSLLLNTFPYMLLITMLTFFIHTLAGNKFLGHGLVVLFYALTITSGRLGLQHILFKYGSSISESYSGMNGFQKFIGPTLLMDFYWLMLGIIFLTLSFLLVRRGSEQQLKYRLGLLKLNIKKGYGGIVIFLCLVLFIMSGFAIYRNTNVLNVYRTKKEDRIYKATYEKTYSRYDGYEQPEITDVDIKVDIFPTESHCITNGTCVLVNGSQGNIDTIHLRIKPEIRISNIQFGKELDTISISNEYGYFMYRLHEPMKPGDTMHFAYTTEFQEKGFSNWGKRHELVPNGTFFHGELLPWFGYDESFILTKKQDRKKAGLPERKFEMAELGDSTEYDNTYISQNAHRISYKALLSTEPDQIALTCGELKKEWVAENRRYFQYEMHEPIWNFVPFLSARYEVRKEVYNGIELSLYYHKGHEYNLDKMIDAMKKTITYCNNSFGPYQHHSIRIVEFPRYELYAQSFPGIIPFSEGVGFIMDVDKKNDIDIPFYVTAHEIAHQWWGHQICPANVKGNLLMVESLANYTAIMVMEKESGIKNISKFLEYEQNHYLLGRAVERKKEVPLYLVDDQSYMAYNKGSVVLYSLRDYIGEENLNKALKDFLSDYSYRKPPYPVSTDFLGYLEKVIPDTMAYLVQDLFKTITLFSNRIDSTYYEESEGKYRAALFATCEKFIADSIGKQGSASLNDWIDVGFFGEDTDGKDSLIFLEKIHVDSVHAGFTVMLTHKPVKAGIDPYYKLIDRNLTDNIKEIRKL